MNYEQAVFGSKHYSTNFPMNSAIDRASSCSYFSAANFSVALVKIDSIYFNSVICRIITTFVYDGEVIFVLESEEPEITRVCGIAKKPTQQLKVDLQQNVLAFRLKESMVRATAPSSVSKGDD